MLKLAGLLRPRRPYQLFQVEPSLECNLECVMCPWSSLRHSSARMAWETFTCIAQYFPLAAGVDLTGGGEPTTHPRLAEMVRVAKQAGCKVGFSTNATLLDPHLSESLVSLGLDWISFSVDAATAQTYERIRRGAEFECVVHNIQALRDAKAARGHYLSRYRRPGPSPGRPGGRTPRMMMVFVMMRENFHELPAYVDLAHRLGVEQIILKNLDVILKDGDDERRLFSHQGPPLADVEPVLVRARQRATELGVQVRLYAMRPQEQTMCENDPLHNLFFNWAGYVSPCITLSYAEDRVFDGTRHYVPCQRFGLIQEESLEHIWDKAAYRDFRRAYQLRLAVERQAAVQALIGSEDVNPTDMPPAPVVCRTCYYLYGI